MSEFFEIAYAAASKKLCFFTGTGFSKAVTSNNAPNWRALLESLCDLTANPNNLKSVLFPADKNYPLSLEEAAQIVEIELLKTNKLIHHEVANLINALTLTGDNSSISDFLAKNSFRVITTNYDKLVEKLSGEQDCHSITPGRPIPRSQTRVEIYHVHGSVDSPENMVVTSDDYFNFINNESYFSRKLSTVLHENTVVILGYSLSDTNLKAIISDYKGFSRDHSISSNLFLISKAKVDQHIKSYYSHCYGIRVLDQMEIHSFFKQLNLAMPKAEKHVEKSVSNIKNVVYGTSSFTDEYLKIEDSFFEIISSLAAVGMSIKEPKVVSALGKIIENKIKLTHENGAWTQYEHLARWLIHLGSILELKKTSIEDIYLNAALQSMSTMSKKLKLGYSWHAFQLWNNRWSEITSSNRAIIKKYIEEKLPLPDALEVVKQS